MASHQTLTYVNIFSRNNPWIISAEAAQAAREEQKSRDCIQSLEMAGLVATCSNRLITCGKKPATEIQCYTTEIYLLCTYEL